MLPLNEIDADTRFLIGIIITFFFILLMVKLVLFFDGFFKELKYLNSEIKRSDGVEKHKWIRQRWRLFLSLFPFINY